MKYLMVVFLMCAGCQSVVDWTNASGREKHARDMQALEVKKAAEREKQALLVPGTSLDLFKAKWGEPVATEFNGSEYVLKYSKLARPMVFKFNDQGLRSWAEDSGEVQRRLAEDLVDSQNRPRSQHCSAVGNQVYCNEY